ncbi:MAG TPA: hypothetical protein VN923_04220, partial [Thermoanaerobaculia bacterium]|nr:hypothetical protein [Thermoanaerobaculia bacterium]
IDLYPTLLAAAGIVPGPTDGRDLRTLIASGRHGRPAVFAEQADGEGASVRTGKSRYFVSVASKLVPAGIYFYDLASDPAELVNLAGKGRKEERDLRATLAHWLRGGGPRAPKGHLTAEEEAALRALGYD